MRSLDAYVEGKWNINVKITEMEEDLAGNARVFRPISRL